MRGTLNLPATGVSTATAGKNSQALTLTASSFKSGTGGGAVNQNFLWQAEPRGNDTATPSGTLNLLFGSGTKTPSETGLNISSNGIITFAPGQTLPTIVGNENVTGNLSATGSLSGASANFTGPVSTGNETVNGNISTTGSIATNGNVHILGNLRVEGPATSGSGKPLASWGGQGDFAIDAPGVVGGRFIVKDATGNVGIGTSMPSNPVTIVSNSYQPLFVQSPNTFGTWLQLNNTSGGGHNWAILSAGSANAEGAGNLGITNFTGNSTIFLEGNVNANSLNAASLLHVGGNTNPTTIAQGAYLGWNALTGGTGETDFINNQGGGSGGFAFMNTPSSGNPRSTLMFIAGSGKVGIGTVDPAATLDVAGSVRINGDTPMSSNPHMVFSGFIPGSFCGDFTCGVLNTIDALGGFFVPDKSITITRMSVALGEPIDRSCGTLPIIAIGGTPGGALFKFTVPSDLLTADSGPISINVAAGTQLLIFLSQLAGNCTVGTSAGGNPFINVQYVMQ